MRTPVPMLALILAVSCGAPAPSSKALLSSRADDNGPVFVAGFGNTGQDGPDTNTITVKDNANQNHTITTDIPLTHPVTASNKAKKIADAINKDSENKDAQGNALVRAVRVGSTVSIVGQGTYRVHKAEFKDKSKQGEIKWKKASIVASEGLDPLPTEIAYVTFFGSISGLDPSGGEAFVQVGTERGTSLRYTAAFVSIEDLVDALVADLQAQSIDASKVNATQLKIRLFGPDDHTVIFASVDTTLDISGALENAVQ